MSEPLVSVIIPAYNGGELLDEAIQSVLDQTYQRFELLVVDDASVDGTREVTRRFSDGRLKYIRHGRNQGPGAARLTALGASAGEIVAFLDQDDYFHPCKLGAHVSFLSEHPDVGLSYNPHFVVSHPPGAVAGIWRPPAHITIADLLLGFPIGPSVWVLRREWLSRDELWDDAAMRRGAETVFCGRLLFAGCRFGFVDRVLNYRRIHVGRRFGDPFGKCRDERSCHEVVLTDPRCPVSASSVRDAAAANNCLVWANVALVQGETDTGVALLKEALRLDPTLANGSPTRIAEFIVSHAVVEAPDPEAQLRSVFRQLPAAMDRVATEVEWAVSQAQLIKGAQHTLWGRPREAERYLTRAIELGAQVDDAFLRRQAYELRSYETEYGAGAANDALERLGAALALVGGTRSRRRLGGVYHLDRAFHLHAHGQRRGVAGSLVRGLIGDPRSVTNRGAWSILLRTAFSPRLSS